MWWRDVLKLLNKFKGMAAVNLGNGSTCLLWSDLWGGQVHSQAYPELFSFAKNQLLTVQSAKQIDSLHQLLHLPLSVQALTQLQTFLPLLDNSANSTIEDVWGYIWGSNHYSASKGYKQLSGLRMTHHFFPRIWKSAVQNKHKVFFWLLLKDRLSTRGLLQRRNMILDDYNCVLCMSSVVESREHLFLDCPMTRQCWQTLQLQIFAPHDPLTSFEGF